MLKKSKANWISNRNNFTVVAIAANSNNTYDQKSSLCISHVAHTQITNDF